jgi:transcriptional regulator PpsR
MLEEPILPPDITITLDRDGVIQNAVSSAALDEERLEDWRGRSWGETVDPAIGAAVRKMIDAMRQSGDSSYLQVRQRFPSGRELPIEYTTISLGKKAGFVAVGRSLETIVDLQSRLVAAQQAREQDYWKLREIETRYRLLFDASNEAVVLVRATNLRIVEANLAASKQLGLVPGGEFFPDMPGRDRKSFEMMLDRVREQGRAPGIAIHLDASPAPWSLRANLMTTQSDGFYLFQMSPMGGAALPRERSIANSFEDIIQRLPDGFAIIDRDAIVRRANNTFLDLAQVGAESAVIGQTMKKWMSRPGADVMVILNMVQRHGSVRMMTTTLEGELGSLTEVEVSAVGDAMGRPDFVGLLLRDITTRARADGAAPRRSDAPSPESSSLEAIVRMSTEAIERSTIAQALERSQGNRTAAAKYLELSRQSLHAKLKRYGFDEK